MGIEQVKLAVSRKIFNGLIYNKKWVPDELYVKWRYYVHMGRKLDLKHVETYNEKIQWLKLYDRNPLYTLLADKYEVKKYVSDKIGKEYVIPLYGVWEDFDRIDFNNLPKQFVLKCTHDSGGIVVCHDKGQFDHKAAKKILMDSLNTNFYYYGREWPYKNIKPRIIAEAYMEDTDKKELTDYKFFCFDGEPKMMFVATDRLLETEDTKFDFFDMSFQNLHIINGHPNATKEIKCPQSFEQMKRFARELSQGIPHVRVDFYEVDGHPYFGEFTFAHHSGQVPFEPEKWDRIMGDWIRIPNVCNSGEERKK